ncbi:MAG: PilZ domain-containing protein [Nitrospiraceae bacterium]
MPFSIRPLRRFPICCPVTYHAGLSEGSGIIWNLSLKGWRLSGDVPLRVGRTCPMTVHLPDPLSLFVAGVIARWVQGQKYGLETLVADKQTQSRVEQLVHHLGQVALESIE